MQPKIGTWQHTAPMQTFQYTSRGYVMILAELHKSIILLANRAERIEGEVISQSFVDSQPLAVMLASQNNQIV